MLFLIFTMSTNPFLYSFEDLDDIFVNMYENRPPSSPSMSSCHSMSSLTSHSLEVIDHPLFINIPLDDREIFLRDPMVQNKLASLFDQFQLNQIHYQNMPQPSQVDYLSHHFNPSHHELIHSPYYQKN